MKGTNRNCRNIEGYEGIEGDSIGRILIVEFNGQDSPAFDEVMGVLKRYRDFEYVQIDDDSILSVPGLEIYPSRRKIYRGRKEICRLGWIIRAVFLFGKSAKSRKIKRCSPELHPMVS